MATSEQFYIGRNRHAEPPPPSPSVSKSKPKSKAKWSCTECTYLNDGKKKRCDMCLTPKPKPKHRAKVASVSMSSSHVNNGYNHHHQDHNHNHNHNHNNYSHQRHNSYHRKPKKGVQFNNHNKFESPRSIATSPSTESTFFRVKPGRIPNGSIVPEHIVFNPHKPVAKQSIFERWMIAQMERQNGQQPTICVENNVLLTNLRRVRAPTTFQTLQQQINANTDAMQHANNLDAGDFTDDEDEEEFSGGFSPRSPPRSPRSFDGATPTTDIEEDQASSFSAYVNEKKMPPLPKHAVSAVHLNGMNGSYNHNHIYNHNHNAHKRPLPAVPQSVPKNGMNGLHHNKDDNLGSDARFNGVPRAKSSNYAEDVHYNHKKLLDGRRRKRTKHRNKNQTVADLWFRAQSQLKQGRNPSILAKYNITLTNIRQHNPRFKDFQRRRSHHEKAATYLANTGDKLRHTIDANKDIDNDDDDYSDSDNDNDNEDGHTPSSIQGNCGSYNAVVSDNFLE